MQRSRTLARVACRACPPPARLLSSPAWRLGRTRSAAACRSSSSSATPPSDAAPVKKQQQEEEEEGTSRINNGAHKTEEEQEEPTATATATMTTAAAVGGRAGRGGTDDGGSLLWMDPPHIAAAKERLRVFEDLYAVLGVSSDANEEAIIRAYNERGAHLASLPDFGTSPKLQDSLKRLKHAVEVLLDKESRLEYDARRRSVQEALRRLEVDPGWARGKEKLAEVGRTFFHTKMMWALGIFAAVMGVYTYIAVDLTRRQREGHLHSDRTTSKKD